jgi:5-methylcytosine-specific restriction endonuclease McrA
MSYIERDKNGNRVYRIPNCQCSVCGTEIYRRPNEIAKGNVYCSKECRAKGHTKNIFTCQSCGKKFHRKHHKKSHVPKYCSKSCSNRGRAGTYEYGSYQQPRNKAHKSRVLKLKLAKDRGACCERCGEDNFYVLEVHHVIEKAKGGTDDLDNLELLCGNCHNEHHRGWGDMDDYIKEYKLEKWCKANL